MSRATLKRRNPEQVFFEQDAKRTRREEAIEDASGSCKKRLPERQ